MIISALDFTGDVNKSGKVGYFYLYRKGSKIKSVWHNANNKTIDYQTAIEITNIAEKTINVMKRGNEEKLEISKFLTEEHYEGYLIGKNCIFLFRWFNEDNVFINVYE